MLLVCQLKEGRETVEACSAARLQSKPLQQHWLWKGNDKNIT